MRRFDKNLTLGDAISRAIRQRFDLHYGGHRSKRFGLADSLAQSVANDLVAPNNNRPGREGLRRSWGNNFAGMMMQEGVNSLLLTGRRRK